MNTNNRRGKPGGKIQAQASRQRRYTHRVMLLLILAVITGAAFWVFHGEETRAQSTVPAMPQESVAAPEVKAGFDSLKGRWLRPDGGYVIEIREIDNDGKMVAAYFNPRPINVSRAEASQEGTTTTVFIELRDTNYPGATYTLAYEPQSDQLKGIYFQPALQQSFDVVFVRMK